MIMTSETTLYTKHSSDEEDDDDQINFQRVQFNEHIWDALVASRSGDTQTAIQKYDLALKLSEKNNEIEKSCLAKR